ncbi:MAG: PAS domain S-box protein [Pirellulales bacterium]
MADRSPLTHAHEPASGDGLPASPLEIERALAQERERLRITLASIGDAVITTDAQGRVTFLNRVAEQLIGWPQAEALGRPLPEVFEIVNHHTRQPVENPALQALAEGRVVALANHTILIARDGAERPIDDSAAPMCDDQGQTVGAVLVFRDVSERMAAQLAQARLATIVESSDDAILSKTLEGVITSWNAGAERLFGYTAAEAVGRSITMIIPLERRDEETKILARLRRGERIEHFETIRVAKDGRLLEISLSVSPLRDSEGQIIGASKIARDISARRQAELALRESEERFRQLADTIPQLAWYANADGYITWYNRRWYEYTGTTPADMEGWGWQSVHDPAMLPQVLERWKSSLASGEPFDMTFPLRGADGRFRPFLTRVHPFKDDAGQVVRWFGTNTDVTDRIEAEQRLREESNVVETIHRVGRSVAAELDLNKLLQTATDATTELSAAQFGAFFYNVVKDDNESYLLYTVSGVPRERFESFPMPRATEVFAPTFRGEGVVRLDDVTRDLRYGRNAPYHGMPTGHLPVRSYLAVPVVSRSGEVLGGLFLGHEQPGVFTERAERLVSGIAAQAAVAIDNARLFDAVRRASAEQDKLLESERAARNESERASRIKDEFLATLSHELRTPLNAILGWAQVLRMSEPAAPEVLRDGIDTIERNARSQARIIDDLLDMSRIISGKIRLDVQQLDLAGVIRDAVATVQTAADAKEIRLQTLLDPLAGPIAGDPNRLGQVFWNLLSNAVKFTSRGGRVQVLLERVNSHLEVSVIDSGEGIDPAFLPHVFDRFRQADATTTRRHGGLGLGLAIVKQLVELHGGGIRAKSPGKGQGATFVVSLPLTIVHPEPAPSGERRHPQAGDSAEMPDLRSELAGLTILVVDDEPDARNLLRRLLEDCQVQVLSAANAAEALELVERRRPDLLVSDVGMPKEDGYKLLRRVRALPADKGGSTPAVALTAYARPEDRVTAILAGFQHHLTKPVQAAELIAILASLARTLRSDS